MYIQIGAVVFFAIMLVVSLVIHIRRKNQNLALQMNREQGEAKRRFEEKISVLRGTKFVVVVRQKDGKISDFESILVNCLSGMGAHIQHVPGKTARQIWEEVFYENKSEVKLKEAPLCFLVGTVGEEYKDKTIWWFNYQVITSDFSLIVGSHRMTSWFPEYWQQEFLSNILRGLSDDVRKLTNLQMHFT